ncbi:MAG TPA: Ig-like domain-containing protein [Candidatus Paceibacterota bacterium]|nr:Ig-like domain-containing protein [Candidatus Paceibacterota bacterium]
MASVTVKKCFYAASFCSIAAAGLVFGLIATPVLAQTLPAQPAPHIAGISPASGPVGTQVTMTGTDFSEADMVNFGPGLVVSGITASADGTQITFTVPSILFPWCTIFSPPCSAADVFVAPATYSINVVNAADASSTSNVVSFTLTPSAVITSIDQVQGQIGTLVTINGTGFSTRVNAINFDTASKQGVILQMGNSSSVIQFVIPNFLYPRCAFVYPNCPVVPYAPSAGTYSISVAPDFNFNQISNGIPFALQSGSIAPVAPVITSITPTSGTIGTQITVKGYGFSPNLNVIDFGTGFVLGSLSGSDLVFNIPSYGLTPKCAFFSTPPCNQPNVPLPTGTYYIDVATDATTHSNALPLTVNPIPLPVNASATPAAASSTEFEVSAIANLNVRSSASLSASIVSTIASGTLGVFMAGPVSANGYDWFQIQWLNGVSGWSVGNYIAPVSNSVCPIKLKDYVYATAGGDALTMYVRGGPSLASAITGAEAVLTKGTVVSGPVLADLHYWWDVQFPDGVSGWATEDDVADVSCVSTKNIPTNFTLPTVVQAPVITFITPQSGATISGQAPITVSVSSSYPVADVNFYNDNTLIGTVKSAPYTMTLDATKVWNGSHTLKAHVDTTEGVSAENSVSVNVTGGLFAPIVTFVTPQSGATVSGQVSVGVAVSSSMPITSVDFYRDNLLIGTDTAVPYTATFNATQLVDGYHSLVAVANTAQTGINGSQSEWIQTTGGIQSPSVTAPTIAVSFVAPQVGVTVSGVVPITVSVSSSVPIAGGVVFSVAGKYLGTVSAAPYTISWDSSQALNGWTNLVAVANDGNGNAGSASMEVNVTGGLSYPTVTFVTPQSGATVSGQVPVTVSVSAVKPAMTKIDLYDGSTLIGSGTASPFTASWNAAQAYNGPHTLVANVQTAVVGITGSALDTVNVTGGIPPPAISVSITAPQDGATVFGKVPIAATISSTIPISKVDFYENGQLVGTATSTPYAAAWDVTQATPGTYTITAMAWASSGLTAGQSISVNVIATPLFSAGEKVAVQTDSNIGLNVRSGPSTNYSIVGTEPNGSLGKVVNTIPVVANGYNWWQVAYSDGVNGWSVETYLVAAP